MSSQKYGIERSKIVLDRNFDIHHQITIYIIESLRDLNAEHFHSRCWQFEEGHGKKHPFRRCISPLLRNLVVNKIPYKSNNKGTKVVA